MKNLFLFILILPFLSCAPEFYSPNRINIPELGKKKDFKITIVKGYIDFEAQTAYGLTNHIGILCNYANTSYRNSSTNFEVAGGRMFEIGGGYFTKKRSLIFENYITFGRGSFFNRAEFLDPLNEKNDGKLDSDFSKFGIQSSLSLQHDLFSISGALRYTNLQYTNITGNMYSGNQNLREFLNLNSGYNFIEPAFQIGIGFKNIRINVQYQRSYVINKTDYYYYNKYNYSAGILLSFPAIGNKSKKGNT
ncbi:MAG: hypothetical protein U0V54_13400 [Saprospiraceae bacterium]